MQALQDMMIRMMLIEDDMKRIQYVRKIVAWLWWNKMDISFHLINLCDAFICNDKWDSDIEE